MKHWRPKEGWNNPYKYPQYTEETAYEAGADAILRHLKKDAIHIKGIKGWEYLKDVYEDWLHGNKVGYIVFIEEEE